MNNLELDLIDYAGITITFLIHHNDNKKIIYHGYGPDDFILEDIFNFDYLACIENGPWIIEVEALQSKMEDIWNDSGKNISVFKNMFATSGIFKLEA